jgi:hypothetical protein
LSFFSIADRTWKFAPQFIELIEHLTTISAQ